MYYLGIDLGGTNIKSSIFTNDFKLISQRRDDTYANKGSSVVLQRMLDNISQLLKDTNVDKKDIVCIGIGVPGLLDRENGISKFSPNFLDWENVHVTGFFESNLNIPTFIDNDVRMNLYGELYFGAARGKKNVVLLTLGTGLGSGVVIDGHVLYGATSCVGEIGHMNMYRSGRQCRCGSSGCLGRYVSAIGIVRTIKEKIEKGEKTILLEWTNNDVEKITAEMMSKAYDAGDKLSIDTFNETGEILGFGLTNVINLYNPEIIVIGGGMSAAGERLLKRAREIINSHALKISREVCQIVTSELGDSSGMLGAAIYAKNELQNRNK